tara:strand:- start:515 stop:1291 length:777 start_codon:yes stop_codon:yes gene_type:complete
MNILEKDYKKILNEILNDSVVRDDRTGVGCISSFSKQLKWDLSNGKFPLFTGKRMFKKIFETEFKWFTNGETNIKRFQDAGVKIWDAWANENGELGPVYGYQMMNYNGEGINQLDQLIDSLKNNKDSRRHIISLWNPLQMDKMALPPCYHNFQFFVEGDKLNMHVLQRSADLFLGIPYDVALFSRLLLFIAGKVGMSAARIDLTMIDCHIYSNQFEQVDKYLSNATHEFPNFSYDIKDDELTLIDYKCENSIKAEVAV